MLSSVLQALADATRDRGRPEEPEDTGHTTSTVVWSGDQTFMWSDDDPHLDYVISMSDPAATWTVTVPPSWWSEDEE